MKARAVRRAILAFCLEAQIITSLLALFGYLPVSFTSLFGFSLLAILLFSLGGWLYYGGGGSMRIHLLLYPLVAAIGIASYFALDSWIAAIVLAGVFYWRVHNNVTIRLFHYDILQRFILTIVIIVTHLIYNTVVLSLFSAEPPDNRHLFGMLSVLMITFIVVSWGEYLTREKPSTVSLSTSAVAGFSSQLLQAKALLTAGYAAAGAVILALLFLIWNLLKTPFYALLTFLAGPIIKFIEALVAKLEAIVRNHPQLQNVDGKDGNTDQVIDPLIQNGASLATLLKPYLIAAVIIAFAAWLGWKMWKVRYHKKAELTVDGNQSEVAVSAVEEKASSGNGIGARIRSMLDNWFGPKDDPARYLYYQFLRYMASQGVAMRKDETSHEFMRRVSNLWSDQTRLSLVEKITSYYEQHRYDRSSLTSEELASLESCFQQLRKTSTR